MRIRRFQSGTKIWLSAHDTRGWAHKPGAVWPCSFLSGRRLFAEFDARGDLVDMYVDGGRGNQDCPSDEFDAIVSDFIGSAHPKPEAGELPDDEEEDDGPYQSLDGWVRGEIPRRVSHDGGR